MATIKTIKPLPEKWKCFDIFTTPKVWVEARKHYGLLEKEKGKVVPELHDWSKEMKVDKLINKDNDFPWCGLFMAIVIKRAGWTVVKSFLAAISWLNFGITVWRPKTGFTKGMQVCFMDILIFSRPGGNHVCFAFAQNKDNYLCYGGNQSNAVGFAWISKSRLIGVQRPDYKSYQPLPLLVTSFNGTLSHNES